ncbi:MAG: FAD-dependent oxidoreductase [Planctomycetia bacterium]|nr:FAD-dependent oxidoreductase [Planctomycetia bacterium]
MRFFQGMAAVFATVFLCLAGGAMEIIATDEAVCDVLVVGGGTAGVPAAVQSARAGAKTILVEMGFQLGGTTTTAGVRYPGLFHAWGKQVIAGIGWELTQAAVALNGDKMPDFSVDNRSFWLLSIPVNPPLFAILAEEMCVRSGVALRYYETPCALEKTTEHGAHWKVTTTTMGQFRTIWCREIVDATGNGTVAAMAGAVRLREEETQPGSIFYRIDSGIDFSKVDWDDMQVRYQKAIADGVLLPEDMFGGVKRFLTRPRPAGNRTYVYHADNATGPGRTDANIRGRASILRSLRFIKTLPGGENAKLVEMSAETGVRETYRIQGKYVITEEDYRTGKVWPDSVAFAFYPIDLHTSDGAAPKRLEKGVVPTIPYRALIADGVEHLLMAGRCISSDRQAGSALRVQSVCMASGQAAGAGAALAAKENVLPENVPLDRLKALLREHGAIVP